MKDKVLAHWQRLLDQGPGGPEKASREQCDYCTKHWTWYDCGKCPVKLHTGRDHCHGTPFSMADKALADGIGNWRVYVQAEIDFLRGVPDVNKG